MVSTILQYLTQQFYVCPRFYICPYTKIDILDNGPQQRVDNQVHRLTSFHLKIQIMPQKKMPSW